MKTLVESAERYLEEAETTNEEWLDAIKNNEASIVNSQKLIQMIEAGETLPEADKHVTIENLKKAISGIEQCNVNIKKSLNIE